MNTLKFMAYLAICLIVGLTATASTSTSNTSSPTPNPRESATISFTFDGMMALCLGDSKRISVGILDVSHHRPEILITRVKDNQKQLVASWKADQLKSTLYFDVEGNQPNISIYKGNPEDPNNFDWTVDMETDLFQKRLYVRENLLAGKVHISSGLLYARNLSKEKYRFISADNSGKILPFYRRMAEPAAKLNLHIGDTLVIKDSDRTIKLVADPGVQYEIQINNLPPDEMASMDHWLFYYDFIETKVERYSPIAVQKAAFGPGALWCDAAIFSKSRLN